MKIRHQENSLICSMDDEPWTQVSQHPEIKDLLKLASNAAAAAADTDLSYLSPRLGPGPFYNEVWPGEHYKFIAGLVRVLQPKVVVEIGTGGGLSALSMLKFLPPDGKLITFDTVNWKQVTSTVLRESDFEDKRLNFAMDDLTDPLIVGVYAGLLSKAELIFMDAAKDIKTELSLLKNLETIPFENPPVMLFDDIRLMNMISVWRALPYPKLDVTSFGHWSGTGLISFKPR